MLLCSGEGVLAPNQLATLRDLNPPKTHSGKILAWGHPGCSWAVPSQLSLALGSRSRHPQAQSDHISEALAFSLLQNWKELLQAVWATAIQDTIDLYIFDPWHGKLHLMTQNYWQLIKGIDLSLSFNSGRQKVSPTVRSACFTNFKRPNRIFFDNILLLLETLDGSITAVFVGEKWEMLWWPR